MSCVAIRQEINALLPKQRRMRTYANQAETAFACEIGELYEEETHDYAFDNLPPWVTSVSSGWPPSAAPIRPSWTRSTSKYPSTLMPSRTSLNA